MTPAPIISVILPVRNEEKYIKSTIDSILSQSFADFELLVINDGSSDTTKRILEEYMFKDKRVRIIDNLVSIGVANSLNKALEAARGKYIARIDAADTAERLRFQKQVEYMEASQETFILGSWAYIINDKKELIAEWKTPAEITDKILYKKNGAVHPTVLIRKDLFNKIGNYNPFYKRAEDYELWARAVKNKLKIKNLQEFLTAIMEREEGMSTKYLRAMARDTFKIKLKYLPYFLSLANLSYTLRSLIGSILPLWVFNLLARRYGEKLSCKIFIKR